MHVENITTSLHRTVQGSLVMLNKAFPPHSLTIKKNNNNLVLITHFVYLIFTISFAVH